MHFDQKKYLRGAYGPKCGVEERPTWNVKIKKGHTSHLNPLYRTGLLEPEGQECHDGFGRSVILN